MALHFHTMTVLLSSNFDRMPIKFQSYSRSRPHEEKAMASSSKNSKKKNYKGRSPNVMRYIESCGSEVSIGHLIGPNLASGTRIAAKNQCQALDEKTARTYELRLIALENFAKANGDDAILFGPNKRPFLAATIQTFMRKCFLFILLLMLVNLR